jgi:hypothetical protein
MNFNFVWHQLMFTLIFSYNNKPGTEAIIGAALMSYTQDDAILIGRLNGNFFAFVFFEAHG